MNKTKQEKWQRAYGDTPDSFRQRVAASLPKGEESRHVAFPRRAAVLAAADGVVRMAGCHKSYGNYLRVLHADGDETLYAHLQYLFVRAGEAVGAGQTLGTVGQTGNATGPHLHFEILHRGLRYDPAAALQHAS